MPPIRERGGLPDDVKPRSKNCTQHNQFTLHANTYIAPLDRKGLEKMIRYLCRPALATHRVELLENDEVVRLKLKTPWRDGTTGKSGRRRILGGDTREAHRTGAAGSKLGVFAANAKWRREVVLRPKPPKRNKELANGETACEHAAREAKPDDTQPGHALSRLSWSEAMKRTFKLDVLQCVCGGRREVIALIPSGEIATKILAHLRLLVTAEACKPPRLSTSLRATPPTTARRRNRRRRCQRGLNTPTN